MATTATSTSIIKKPPRKSKLPEATFRVGGGVASRAVGGERRFKKNGESEEQVYGIQHVGKHSNPRNTTVCF